MLYGEERKIHILEYIQKNSRASVQELSLHFEVSESTIRRDLKELEEAKLLRRTHGGAVSLQGVNFEPTFGEKEDKFRSEKEAIAKKAIELIEEEDTILIDSGTTTFHLANALKTFSRLTVVTNSIMIAKELEDSRGIEVLLTGGILRRETLALVGPFAEQSLSMVRVDKAFIATNGLDIHEGLTTPNLVEASTKRKMIKSAKQVILLSDHSKMGKISFAKFAEANEIDKLVVDQAAPVSVIKQWEDLGVDVYVVCP
ncbi:DeoR/GlpR family DNA-binding transcription regulator [Microaerobacter geothermalis]|uniref:DeoR/GlpR family DNA-binding transcription regulator n=1 Tax=Microaerobacter geothermalis TaxID=674972 RepID=UPI001F47BAFC|nr:DeoR/GlpR family DNA-binding transcription regulator [Microaerobacter geothermalis]MCF6093940.1 DeoR/GlpR family DNA-binding transcription regulator [Microaerobacter geothermalis]